MKKQLLFTFLSLILLNNASADAQFDERVPPDVTGVVPVLWLDFENVIGNWENKGFNGTTSCWYNKELGNGNFSHGSITNIQFRNEGANFDWSLVKDAPCGIALSTTSNTSYMQMSYTMEYVPANQPSTLSYFGTIGTNANAVSVTVGSGRDNVIAIRTGTELDCVNILSQGGNKLYNAVVVGASTNYNHYVVVNKPGTESTSGSSTLYINGKKVAENTYPINVAFTSLQFGARPGGMYGGENRAKGGNVDDIRVYAQELSPKQIMLLKEEFIPPLGMIILLK